MSSFLYFLREALKGLGRHLSTTFGSIVTIFLSLLIIGAFLIGGSIVQNIVDSVESEVNITAYVSDKASQDDINKVEDWIKTLDGVSSVTFTTKEQALENFKKSMSSSPDIIDQLDGENPLPASIDIELSDPQKVESVENQIKDNEDFKNICDNKSDPSDSLKYGKQTVERLFALIILMVFISFVFINNTIRLAILSRRREIAIMRLVGASNGFIRGPFLMEGALNALIGTALAIICLELIRNLAMPQLTNALMWLPVTLDGGTYVMICVSLLVFGLVIGCLGAMLAMRRYLKI